MRKICVLNFKGGVGKTTTAINVAAGLAIKGKRVLLLDLDAQGHVAKFFPIQEYKKDMFEFITNGADARECSISVGTNLDVITSSEKMRDAELLLSHKEEPTFALSEKLENVSGYDYVIIDCPPAAGLVTQNALNYVEEVIIPVSTEPLALSSLEKTMETIKRFSDHSGNNLEVTKIVPTMYDRRNKICRKILHELQNQHYELVADPISISSKLKEAPREKRSIFKHARSSRAAKEYAALVSSLITGDSVPSPEVEISEEPVKVME